MNKIMITSNPGSQMKSVPATIDMLSFRSCNLLKSLGNVFGNEYRISLKSLNILFPAKIVPGNKWGVGNVKLLKLLNILFPEAKNVPALITKQIQGLRSKKAFPVGVYMNIYTRACMNMLSVFMIRFKNRAASHEEIPNA